MTIDWSGVALIAGPVSAYIMARTMNAHSRKMTLEKYAEDARVKAEDRKREDEVADRLRARQDEVDRKSDQVAVNLEKAHAQAANIASVQGKQLTHISILVNSTLTAEKEKSLRYLRVVLVLLLESVENKRTQGLNALPQTLIAIDEARAEIAEAELGLRDRARQAEIAALQTRIEDESRGG